MIAYRTEQRHNGKPKKILKKMKQGLDKTGKWCQTVGTIKEENKQPQQSGNEQDGLQCRHLWRKQDRRGVSGRQAGRVKILTDYAVMSLVNSSICKQVKKELITMSKTSNTAIVSIANSALYPFGDDYAKGSNAFAYWDFANGASISIQVFHSLWLSTGEWTHKIFIHPNCKCYDLQARDLLETLQYVKSRMEHFTHAGKRFSWEVLIDL